MPPIRSITHPTTGEIVRFGRRRPVAKFPRLSLSNYIMKGLPSPPKKKQYAAAASSALSQVYLNDTLGDCVIACMGHIVGVLTGNATGGSPVLFTDEQITALYSAIGGYVPGEPQTDQGCDMQTALSYWENNGALPGSAMPHKISGWIAVDPTNVEEIKTAMWLFEALDFGMELPDAWISPFPSQSGFLWDVAGAPDPNNGHCVAGLGYNNTGVTIDTWGMTGTLSYDAIAEYCAAKNNGELYTLVSWDAINTGTQKAASGFDWSQLVADIDSLGGKVTA